MSIHQIIYDTLDLPAEDVVRIIGAQKISDVTRRRDLIKLFLSENEWDHAAYITFAAKKYASGWFDQYAKEDCLEGAPKFPHIPMPTKWQMAKNLVAASVQAVRHRFKQVSKKEQKRRHTICKTACQWYRHNDDRCSKCGCFTSFKTRLEAWHCPENKW